MADYPQKISASLCAEKKLGFGAALQRNGISIFEINKEEDRVH